MTLTAEYFLYATLAALSMIQVASARGRLKGLLFSQSPKTNRIVNIVFALPPAIAFFTWNFRNPVGIIEGAQQAGLFSLAVLSAIAITAVASSILNHSKFSLVSSSRSMESLKDMTFYQAFVKRYFCKS